MHGLHANAACGCKAGASAWIEVWFGDCVYSTWEMIAFYIGLSSLMFWLVAQVPQFISNWRLQSADALSPWFLLQWLAGDSFNFLGCLLTGDQLATQNLSASYYMFADFMIISQYFYYQQPRVDEKEDMLYIGDCDDKPKVGTSVGIFTQPTNASGRDETKVSTNLNNPESGQYQCTERRPLLSNQACDLESLKYQHQSIPACDDSPSHSKSRHLRQVIMQYGLEYGPPTGSRLTIQHGLVRKHGRSKIIRLAGAAVMGVAGLICLGAATHNLVQGNYDGVESIKSIMGRKLMSICEDTSRIWWLKDSGTILGWGSASLYLGSRVSQVLKVNKRGSAEGLSMAMVSTAILANSTYGVSILMRLYSWQDFLGKAPWLVGSLGTVSLDITLLIQAHYLAYHSKMRKGKLNEYTPLLA